MSLSESLGEHFRNKMGVLHESEFAVEKQHRKVVDEELEVQMRLQCWKDFLVVAEDQDVDILIQKLKLDSDFLNDEFSEILTWPKEEVIFNLKRKISACAIDFGSMETKRKYAWERVVSIRDTNANEKKHLIESLRDDSHFATDFSWALRDVFGWHKESPNF